MSSMNFVSNPYNKPKQPAFGNLVFSGLVCFLDPRKWPSSPKRLPTPEFYNRSLNAVLKKHIIVIGFISVNAVAGSMTT